MQIPSCFTIAVHILTHIAQNKGNETKLTSDLMAGSMGVNPVIIRKTLSQLKKADLIQFKGEQVELACSRTQKKSTFFRFIVRWMVSAQVVNVLGTCQIFPVFKVVPIPSASLLN